METAKKLWQNRKEKKEWNWRLQSEDPGLEVVHPHAAGIAKRSQTQFLSRAICTTARRSMRSAQGSRLAN